MIEVIIRRILVAVKNNSYLFCMASEIIESNELNLISLSGGTRIHDIDEYLENLEKATELIDCT